MRASVLTLLLAACSSDQKILGVDDAAPADDTAPDSVDTAETAETADTGETADTAPPALPDVAVSPTTLDWGADRGPTAQGFRVENVGAADLTLSALDLTTTGDFALTLPDGTALPATLPPGAGLDLVVTYTRATTDASTGEVAVRSDDPDEPVVPVALLAAEAPSACPTGPFFSLPALSPSDAIDLFASRGDGTFDTALTVGSGSGEPQYAHLIHDFDGDGSPEVWSYGGSTAAARLTRCEPATGEWTSAATGDRMPFGVATAGDVDGDGDLDLLGWDATNYTGWTALGNGDGTFANARGMWFPDEAYTGYRMGATRHLADVNGDGLDDVVTWAYGSSDSRTTLFVHLGNGDGTFQPPEPRWYVDQICNTLDLADLDGSGLVDLVIGLDDDGDAGQLYSLLDLELLPTTWVYALDLDPTREATYDTAGAGVVWLRDWDGDGLPDMVVSHYLDVWANPRVEYAQGLGDGTFAAPTTVVVDIDATESGFVYGPL